MDSRFKLKEIIIFVKELFKNLSDTNTQITRKEKISCLKTIVLDLLIIVWNAITSPIVYSLWYLFRSTITKKIYKGTYWQEILILMDSNKTIEIKKKLFPNGKFYYWLWTYGDAEEPLGRGGLPEKYKDTFWNRLYWSGIRNGRYNYTAMEFRTGLITDAITVIDTRNFKFMHKSFGIGDSPDGIYFKWVKDDKGKWYFIYEDNNEKNLFYLGYTGLLRSDIGISGGRFETGYRVTDNSYRIP